MTGIRKAAAPGRLEWQPAEVVEAVIETPRVKSLLLHVARWQGHLPGQHVDIRLTADGGYQAQRSYSIASSPEDQSIVLTVERVDNGEVSPYLLDDLRPGDRFELRGPIGRYFVWTATVGGPLSLVAGRIRHRSVNGDAAPPRQVERWGSYVSTPRELGKTSLTEESSTR